MARLIPNPILHLNAARAAGGTGAGSNTVPTSSFYDLSGNAHHGTLTGFDYEAGDRPRTNSETDKALWHDLSGNGNDGTLSGFAYTEASGWDGVGSVGDPYSLVFTPTDDLVTVPHDVSLAYGADFAEELWGIPVFSGGWWWAWTKSDSASYGTLVGICIQQTTGDLGRSRACVGPWFTDAYTYTSVPAVSLQNTLHQLVVVRSAGYTMMYLDGADLGYHVANTVDLSAVTRDGLHQGPGGTATPFAGALLGHRRYSGALSAAEVAQNYAAGPTGTGYVRDGLVLDLNAARAVRPSGWVEL